MAIFIPGPGGAQVPVFGGVNVEALQPTISPAPTTTSLPSSIPTLPPGVVTKQTMASYYCGKLHAVRICKCPLVAVLKYSK
jgi:hypothetical protein